MSVYQIINGIAAIGLIVGGLDLICGCRFHLGEKFKEGFGMAGQMILSIAGIMSLAPVISAILEPVIVPIFHVIGADAAVFGILLGCDMGGYQLAMSLAENRQIALMMGLSTAAMLGGTLTFSIPIGQAMLKPDDRKYFSKGILTGIAAIPVGSMAGGFLIDVPLRLIIINHIPVIVLSLLLIAGFKYFPKRSLKCIEVFGNFVTKIGIIGIAAGGVSYLTGIKLPDSFTPFMESMGVVCGMSIVLGGMLPVLEIFIRGIEKILSRVSTRRKLDTAAISGLIITTASAVPMFAITNKMSKRGIVINSAWCVTCAALLGSQMSFVLAMDPQMILPFVLAKLISGMVALRAAMMMTRDMKMQIREEDAI